MATLPRFLCTAWLVLAGGAFATAAGSAASRARWHLDVGPSLWLNADIVYGANAQPDPSTAPKTDRIYDDGFNRVDASGNLGDGTGGALASRTGYFGFTSDSQVSLTAGTLALHQLQAASGAYIGSEDPLKRPGVDLNLRLSLAPDLTRRDWGVEVGADFARFKQSSSGAQAATLRLLTDTYALGGVVPQRAPYAGRFSPLPGDQRIGDTPTRMISTVAGTATGPRSFSARTTVVRLGGWIELLRGSAQPASERDRWSVLAHAGPALLNTRAHFSIDEQLQVGTSGTVIRVTTSGSRNRSDLGAFAGVKVRRDFGNGFALIGWGDHLAGSRLTVSGGSRYARLDLSDSFLLGAAIEVRWGGR